MKKTLSFFFVLALSMKMLAGGLMTNTNYHIAFDRMMARGATHEIDAIFSNPAGMAWGHEGWQLSFNWQNPHQNRDIEADFAYGIDGAGMPLMYHKKYEGKATAPFVPGLFASYKHDRWSLGAMFGIIGSGGSVKYDAGLPMFDQGVMALVFQNTGGMLTPDKYIMDSQVKGRQYIYAGQVNFAYRMTDYLSAAVGFRVNYYDGNYSGHVDAAHAMLGNLVNLQLDCTQRGWGFNPLISVNYHYKKWTLAAKYEFRTKINASNTTNTLMIQGQDVKAIAEQIGSANTIATLSGQLGTEMAGKVAAYLPGEKTCYDIPALLSVAVGYEFTPQFRATAEYHFFDDKNAKMSDDRQKELKRGTHEILLGAEYDINKTFTVSLGGQRTDYGLSDGYQTNTSFACDSYSVGFGGAANVNKHLRINVSYFWTMYSDYTKKTATGMETYSRTNGVFGLGVDYKF